MNSDSSADKWPVNKSLVIFLGILHLGGIAALFFFSWSDFFAFLSLYVFAGMGVTLGYHRMLTHRAFEAPLWLRRVLTVWGTLALQRGPITWVADHRLHHARSDTDGDPHNALKGFWWSHLLWMVRPSPHVDLDELARRYAPDLMKDPFMVWINRYYWLPTLILGLALLAWGGIPAVLWGICLRLTCNYHSSWLVNSAAHMWGYRSFDHEIATNNWVVAVLTQGEGWHNNHHAFPTSARHGLRFWEIDTCWIFIGMMAKLGLISKVKVPAREELPWLQKKENALQRQTSQSVQVEISLTSNL